MRISVFIHFLGIYLLCICGAIAQPQMELSPEIRKKFVEDQTAYFAKLDLSDHQKRGYEEITRRYDKQLLSVEWSALNAPAKRKRTKSLNKRKNTEMKVLLTGDQYKLYLKRQKEIREKYGEG